MRTIIAFTGVKSAGKTTAFEYIKQANPNVIEVALADKLKNACAKVFNIPRVYFDSQDLKEKELDNPVNLTSAEVSSIITEFGFTPQFDTQVRNHIGTVLYTPRKIAQYVGTEILRNVSDNVHCEGSMVGVPEESLIIVTDMRFPNEFDFFQNMAGNNFFPFYISNTVAEARSAMDNHPSEAHVLTIAKKCTRIDNNGSREFLKKQVLEAYYSAIDTVGRQLLAGAK